jgi:hypothetical protein
MLNMKDLHSLAERRTSKAPDWLETGQVLMAF